MRLPHPFVPLSLKGEGTEKEEGLMPLLDSLLLLFSYEIRYNKKIV
jgi:hypothetical protein